MIHELNLACIIIKFTMVHKLKFSWSITKVAVIHELDLPGSITIFTMANYYICHEQFCLGKLVVLYHMNWRHAYCHGKKIGCMVLKLPWRFAKVVCY